MSMRRPQRCARFTLDGAVTCAGFGGCISAAELRVKEFNDDGVYMFGRADFPAPRQL